MDILKKIDDEQTLVIVTDGELKFLEQMDAIKAKVLEFCIAMSTIFPIPELPIFSGPDEPGDDANSKKSGKELILQFAELVANPMKKSDLIEYCTHRGVTAKAVERALERNDCFENTTVGEWKYVHQDAPAPAAKPTPVAKKRQAPTTKKPAQAKPPLKRVQTARSPGTPSARILLIECFEAVKSHTRTKLAILDYCLERGQTSKGISCALSKYDCFISNGKGVWTYTKRGEPTKPTKSATPAPAARVVPQRVQTPKTPGQPSAKAIIIECLDNTKTKTKLQILDYCMDRGATAASVTVALSKHEYFESNGKGVWTYNPRMPDEPPAVLQDDDAADDDDGEHTDCKNPNCAIKNKGLKDKFCPDCTKKLAAMDGYTRLSQMKKWEKQADEDLMRDAI